MRIDCLALRLLSAALVVALATVGCGRTPPGSLGVQGSDAASTGTATLTLTPDIVEGKPAGYRAQEVIQTYKRSDVHQLLIKLYQRTDAGEVPEFDSQGVHVHALVSAADLGKQVTLGGLGVDTRYRVRVQAFKLTGTELNQISDDELSFADVYVARDDRAVTGGLRVWLSTVPFSASGDAGLNVDAGEIKKSGSVTAVQPRSLFEFQDPAYEVLPPGTPLASRSHLNIAGRGSQCILAG
jgi:hypothetical protein